MAIPRTAYFSQSGVLQVPGASLGGGADQFFLLPISSASIEVTRPLEAITSFGQFDSVNNVQTNLTTCKCTLKSYLGSGAGGMTGVTANLINGMISGGYSGLGIGITVAPAGFQMSGVLDSLSLDISMGGLGMCDLGFAGIGYPISLSAPQQSALGNLQSTGYQINPITTMSISAGTGVTVGGVTTVSALSGMYATSIKFNFSMPTDVLSALGDNPNAIQGNLVSQMATKPPYKSTISIEGHGVDITRLDSAYALIFGIGNVGIQLPNAKVSARSSSNAAGQISASYSVTAEDVGANFYPINLALYEQTGINITGFGPSYGG